ncbi:MULTISPECIES: hypothetical protein [Calothrix]|uniref:Uncharacterized protein n=2 Tax=Calothrix TaxID=1186 RepID=A0ABR8A8Y8_9CYAN|nr:MULTISPECIES: hypothetical protein [Calothrix]MBD2196460.1 hypothetical protein [Calothrix parietina FACHB-288]MBD2224645.1 hypothetical protein [Calothrix anomala FACHB-343]
MYYQLAIALYLLRHSYSTKALYFSDRLCQLRKSCTYQVDHRIISIFC